MRTIPALLLAILLGCLPAAAQDAAPEAPDTQAAPVAEEPAPDAAADTPQQTATDQRVLAPVEVAPDQPVIDITSAVSRLDADNQVRLADGTALDTVEGEPDASWIVFALHNASDLPVRRVLAFETGAVWKAGLAPVRAENVRFGLWRTVGAPAPAASGGMASRRFVIDMPPGQTATYAVPVSFSQSVPAYLWQPSALASAEAGRAAFSGLLIGALALAFAFFMARWSAGDTAEAHLAALLCGAALIFEIIAQGLAGAAFGWSGEMQVRLFGASLALAAAGGAFILGHLNLALPAANARMTRWTMWAALGAALIALALPSIGLPLARLMAFGVALGGMTTLLGAPGRLGREADAMSLLELRIGWGLVVLAVLIGALSSVGLAPRWPGIELALHAFGVLGALVACYALAGRIPAHVLRRQSMPLPDPAPRLEARHESPPETEPAPVPPAIAARTQIRAEQRNAIALAGASEAVWDLDVTTGALYVDPSLEAHLGLVPGGLGGDLDGWMARVHRDDREDVADTLKSYLVQGNATFSLPMRMRHAEGAVLWMEVKATCFAGPDGQARRCVGTVADVSARRSVEDEMARDILRDRLTGLANRALFIDRLDRACRLREGGTRRVALILADIDRFKLVNESLGHATADTVLAALARRIEGLAAPEDTLARIDGDTFAILIAGWSDDSGPEDIAGLVRETIAQPLQVGDREIFPTASVGVAICESRHETGEQLLGEADIALRVAKNRGGDRHILFQPNMRPERDSLETESALRRAIERDEIKLAYQPIVRLETGELSGFEALIRWAHPERGELSPDVFVPLAEKSGLIIELGHFVLQRAAQDLARWQEEFPAEPPLFVSVNVSSRQLLEGLVGDVAKVLAETGVPAPSIRLEVTESLVMEDPDQSAKVLEEIKTSGVRLALDDFGTGYSSLSHLRRFPFDVVKIDRTFVTGIATGEDDGAIVRSVLSLAGELKLDVVAEGVEDDDQARILTELGCQYGQGFYFGTPMEAGAARKLIVRYRERAASLASEG